MKYINHRILQDGRVELEEELDSDKIHGRIIKPNEPIPDYPEIESDPNFAKYRTQENADAYEAKLEAMKPTADEIEKQKKARKEQEKARKEKEKREQAIERLIQKELKKMEKEK